MQRIKIQDELYQVWVTSYPTDEREDCGYKLVGVFPTIELAVMALEDKKGFEPVITKLVSWNTSVTDISESANGETNVIAKPADE